MSRSRQLRMRDDGFMVCRLLTPGSNMRVLPYSAIASAELKLRFTKAGHRFVVIYKDDEKTRKLVFRYRHYIPENEIRFLESCGVPVVRRRA